MKISYMLAGLLLITGFSTMAVSQETGLNLNLIPAPKRIVAGEGKSSVSGGVVVHSHGLVHVGVDEFCELLRSEGIEVWPDGIGKDKRFSTNFLEGKAVIETIKAETAGQILRLSKRSGLDKNFHPGAEGYILQITPEKIRIIALTDAGVFYGIQTLSQLITSNQTGRSIPCLTIYDYPDFSIRGWQDDISRGPIPTLDYLKKQVRILAAFKLNAMTLYTEHVFKLKRHPTLAPADGITEEQIAELSAFAAGYHVQIIGNFQSFGHMEKILSKPGYGHLAESGHIITPVKEESYQFLKEVYSEVVPAYSSPYFNINCDETFGLGEGPSKPMADSIGIEGIYGYHINRLNDLLKPYQKRILMWGDIAADPTITRLLPKDITVISWGYHDAPSFDYAIRPFSDQGLNFWVAPGVSCWGNIYPNLQVAQVNINNYIRDGYRLGATGVLNTTWDDDGMGLFGNNWYPLIWGAEKSWTADDGKQMADGLFDRAFDRIFFGLESVSAVSWMRSLSSLHQGEVRDILRNGRLFEPVMLFHPEYVADEQQSLNSEINTRLDSLEAFFSQLEWQMDRNSETIDYLRFALAQVRFSTEKNSFRVALYQYLNEMPGAVPAESLKSSLKWLASQAEDLKAGYVQLWNLENRAWWLDRNLQAYDRLIEDLRSVRGNTVLDIAPVTLPGGREIKMRSALDNLPVFYTLDGSEPDGRSFRYEGPIFIDRDVTIRARVVAEGRNYPETVDSLIIHKAVGKLHKLNSTWSAYHPSYDAGGNLGLIDGRTGSATDIRSGRWQGYSGQDIDIELDFGKIDSLNHFSMGFYQHTFSWVILPVRVELFYSDDGINYQLFNTITHNIPVDHPDPVRHEFSAGLNGLKTRYLKVICKYYGTLPDFHSSSGQESMMFADEVIIR